MKLRKRSLQSNQKAEKEILKDVAGQAIPVWTDYSNPEARNWWSSLFSFDKYKVSFGVFVILFTFNAYF